MMVFLPCFVIPCEQTAFEVTVQQGATQLLKRVYGRRENLKVWAFGAGRQGPTGEGGGTLWYAKTKKMKEEEEAEEEEEKVPDKIMIRS